jgi:hypothetical protein
MQLKLIMEWKWDLIRIIIKYLNYRIVVEISKLRWLKVESLY